jgi:phosphate transport system protein
MAVPHIQAHNSKGASVPEGARRTFHQQLEEVRADVVRMAANVSEMLPRSTAALLTSDLELSQQVIDDDDILDDLSLSVEEQCLRLLARQQPMASDLRQIVTALKLNWEIERSGDLAVNIAKAQRRLYGTELEPRARGLIEQMSEEACRLMRLAIDSYAEGNAGLAAALDDMDDRLDGLQIEFVQSILQVYEDERLPLSTAVDLALVARYYERIGDHAVNIGERVRYMVTGWMPEHTGAARAAAKAAVEAARLADDAGGWSST